LLSSSSSYCSVSHVAFSTLFPLQQAKLEAIANGDDDENDDEDEDVDEECSKAAKKIINLNDLEDLIDCEKDLKFNDPLLSSFPLFSSPHSSSSHSGSIIAFITFHQLIDE